MFTDKNNLQKHNDANTNRQVDYNTNLNNFVVLRFCQLSINW